MDNCIFYAKYTTLVNIIISSLKDELLLEREEYMAGFLGLDIVLNKDKGAMTLSQSDLIDKIMEATHMEVCTLKFTYADKISLRQYLDGGPCYEDWNYRSIVVMLLYLAGITCSDIAYAVHQCARFTHQHKTSHDIDV